VIVPFLRDSPSFQLARGKKAEAQRNLRKVSDENLDLVPKRHASDTAEERPQYAPMIGVTRRPLIRLKYC